MQPLGDELVHPLGPRQPLQLVLAEVEELGLLVRREQVVGGLRDEHLTAVPRSADPGGPMDVEAHVSALGRGRLAGMDAHPDAERASDGQSWPASARCASAAARTASRVLPNATKNSSPRQSISWPPDCPTASRISRR